MAKFIRKNGATSNILRVKILDSSVTTGAGLTGLTNGSSGLIISTIADVESAATTYTVAGSKVETITTLGTFAAPTATKVRFKEVDATNHPGVYELQIADARFAVSNAKSLLISLSGATNMAQTDIEVQLEKPEISADALLDATDGVESSITLRQALRAILSAEVAKVSGCNALSPVFRDAGDTKNRISATVDVYGNRSAVTLDLT